MFKNILRGVKSHRCKVISLAINSIIQEPVVYYVWGGASILRKFRRFSNQPPIHPSSFLEITPHKFCIFWKWTQPEYSSNKLCLSSPHTLSTVVSLRSVFTIYSCCIQFWFKRSIARYPLCNAPTGHKQQASQTVMWPTWWINLDCFSYYLVQSWQVEQGCIKLTLLL